MLFRGRAKLSSRGQIVIPKVLREAARVSEGDEFEVAFDGRSLVLTPVQHRAADAAPDAGQGGEPIAEARAQYVVRTSLEPGAARRVAISAIWADRMSAVAEIGRLAAEFAGVSAEQARRESRDELERRGL